MLRVSAKTNATDIDLAGINGDIAAASVGVEYGEQLMQYAEFLASRDEVRLYAAREKLLQVAGARVLVDAAGVAANFQRMVRIADSMGIPVDDMERSVSKQIRAELDLGRFLTSENSSP